ncbi:P-loop containing nucleoside triphosphate hydrolase protein [Chaetomium strumarium]|uniref:P-loop containing nucleoside triphosphate hydrolase protein n=1 Tax=Chaetomium strumarium TaxID=1170767 RepID=A0AAJ0M5G8_9PEZI|nr:P-loop containing nucleoside triphosphate hydrolase protein [Chaetomium strumarium]
MAQDTQTPQQDLLVSASLLWKIDKLRERNIGTLVPLPQLVVVGDQSSGKSSLLESLTGIPFPRGVELCTRYATQITQRRDDVSRVEVSIIPRPNATEAHKKHVGEYRCSALSLEDFRTEFPAILKEVDKRMGIRMTKNQPSRAGVDSGYGSDDLVSDGSTSSSDGDSKPGKMPATTTDNLAQGGRVFSEDVLKIEIFGPSVDYLTVIDVPGIFRTPTEGFTTKEDMAMVRDMVRSYIRDSRTVILAVLPCNIDISNQEILTLADEYDKDGERTLGILTKPDLVPEMSMRRSVCDIIHGNKKPLRLGYYLVRSRGADMSDAEFMSRETEFKKEPWSSLPLNRVGVRALKACLADLLGHMAHREFPKLRRDIGNKLHAMETERKQLGPSRKDANEQRQYLSSMAREFQELTRAGLEAQYAGNGAFEHLIQLRLITQIVNLADAFNREFRHKSVLRRFEKNKGERERELWSANGDEKKIRESAQDIDPDDFPELENIISHEFDVDDPADGITSWISDLYSRSRGMDLVTYSSAVWSSAWKEQSGKWPSMSKAFVSRVIVAIHRFIKATLAVVCADSHVHAQLWSAILDEVLRRYEVGMSAAEFLVASERDTRPYTLNSYFNESRQEARGMRVVDEVKATREHEKGVFPDPRVSLDNVRKAIEAKSDIEDVVEQMHDDLKAYYDIARDRFVDNMLNQAVNYHLLFGPSTPLRVFSQEWVIGLKPDQLQGIAGESPRIREERERLNRSIDDLIAAKEILRQ